MTKIRLLRALVLFTAIFALSPLFAQLDFLRGDVDGDGCVEAIADTIYLLGNLFPPGGGPGNPLLCLDAADINADLVINIGDPVLLLQWGFPVGGPVSISAPGTITCGPAPGGGIGCAAYVCNPCAAQPPDPDVVLSLSAGVPGAVVSVEVLLDTDEALSGLSLGVCHPTGVVDPLLIVQGTALSSLNGGGGPDIFLLQQHPGEGWSVGVVTSLFLAEVLPPALGAPILLVDYTCSGAPLNVPLDFCDTLGTPAVPISATRANGIGFVPTTVGTTINCGPPPPGSFVRGDISGDGVLDSTDSAILEQFLFPGVLPFGPPPEPVGCDLVPNQSGDINDNEVETIADLLMFIAYLDCGGITIPGPSSCGDDPDEGTTGFDMIDDEYLVSAFSMSITGPPDGVRAVDVSLRITSPTTIKAVSLGLLLGSELSLASPPLTMAPGVVADFFGVLIDGNFISVAAGSTTCGTPMMPSSPFVLSPLATLHLELAPFAIFPPVELIQEVSVLGHVRRTTIVDEAFQDHQPFFLSGAAERFARGNANNFDAFVDIADPVYVLGHLFPNPTSLPLGCRDAADSNNDGLLNIADPIYILAYLFASGPIMPGPYPQCGFDQDIDGIDVDFFLNPLLPQCDTPFCP